MWSDCRHRAQSHAALSTVRLDTQTFGSLYLVATFCALIYCFQVVEVVLEFANWMVLCMSQALVCHHGPSSNVTKSASIIYFAWCPPPVYNFLSVGFSADLSGFALLTVRPSQFEPFTRPSCRSFKRYRCLPCRFARTIQLLIYGHVGHYRYSSSQLSSDAFSHKAKKKNCSSETEAETTTKWRRIIFMVTCRESGLKIASFCVAWAANM